MAGRVEQVTAAIEAGRGSARFPGSGELHSSIGVVDNQLVCPDGPDGQVQAHQRQHQRQRRGDSTCAWFPASLMLVQPAGRSAIHRPRVPFWRC